MKQKLAAMTLTVAVAASMAACDGPSSLADVNVRFATDLTGTGTVASVLGDQAGALAPVPLDAVESIFVTITGVDAVRTEGEDGYIYLALAAEQQIDLMALPHDGDAGGLQLADGSVPSGTYTGIRLRYTTAKIMLTQEVTVGGYTFEAGEHDLDVPSGAHTGIKVPFASLDLDGGTTTDVVLTFDANATIQHVTATGSGKLVLVPVLKARASTED